MYLVKNIINAIQTSNYSEMSESEIKVLVKKAKRDYGTTNNTLRRLCNHGVLRRNVGVCKSSKRPSWLYKMDMSEESVIEYIARKEEQQAKYKNRGKLFDFGEEFGISTHFGDRPLVIGHGLAPEHLEGKCLIVSADFEMSITENRNGSQMLTFKRKH